MLRKMRKEKLLHIFRSLLKLVPNCMESLFVLWMANRWD